ncbi:MAG: DUF5698 domain-containing protein [Tissierellia bacterium]|nr:DUF5698 domain-containing protein [Tissierellia bacterium]
MENYIIYFLIFFARICDVSLTTVRTIFMVQGRKFIVMLIGFFEAIVYVVVLGKIVSDLDDPMKIIFYGLGFAAGNYVGLIIEEKLALGELAVNVVLRDSDNDDLIAEIRDNGFGVTLIEGQGRTMMRDFLVIVIKRKDLRRLKSIIDSYDKKAFLMTSTVDPINGGYFRGVKKLEKTNNINGK